VTRLVIAPGEWYRTGLDEVTKVVGCTGVWRRYRCGRAAWL